jgi:hypothetical protein
VLYLSPVAIVTGDLWIAGNDPVDDGGESDDLLDHTPTRCNSTRRPGPRIVPAHPHSREGVPVEDRYSGGD